MWCRRVHKGHVVPMSRDEGVVHVRRKALGPLPPPGWMAGVLAGLLGGWVGARHTTSAPSPPCPCAPFPVWGLPGPGCCQGGSVGFPSGWRTVPDVPSVPHCIWVITCSWMDKMDKGVDAGMMGDAPVLKPGGQEGPGDLAPGGRLPCPPPPPPPHTHAPPRGYQPVAALHLSYCKWPLPFLPITCNAKACRYPLHRHGPQGGGSATAWGWRPLALPV